MSLTSPNVPGRRSTAARCGLVAVLIALGAGCSLVLDEPTPFVEARRDMAMQDRGPVLPDLAVEDAFVGREPLDMAPEPEPDLAPEPEPLPDAEIDAGCPDGGCLDGGM